MANVDNVNIFMSWRLNLFNIFILAMCYCAPAFAELRVDSTIHSIGLEYDTPDDANENASATVRYRKVGISSWKTGLPLFRINYAGDNMLAGSILFLDPDATYEIELSISDPDGLDETQLILRSTKSVPTDDGRPRAAY